MQQKMSNVVQKRTALNIQKGHLRSLYLTVSVELHRTESDTEVSLKICVVQLEIDIEMYRWIGR
jgi:hypothetical protein